MSTVFKPLEFIKKYFAFRLHIHNIVEEIRCKVYVECLVGSNRISIFLASPLMEALQALFAEFDKDAPKPLTNVRKKILREDLFTVLLKTRPKMSAAAKFFWLDDIGCNHF